MYQVQFRPRVLKSLEKFPKKDLHKIKKKIESFEKNLPNPNVTKLRGKNPFHRVRTGDYRIIYQIYQIDKNEVVVLIVKIAHRKEVYQRLTDL